MAKQAQAKTKALDPFTVRLALLKKGWSQARLAKEISKSLTATNLTINHNTFPEINILIRKKLNL